MKGVKRGSILFLLSKFQCYATAELMLLMFYRTDHIHDYPALFACDKGAGVLTPIKSPVTVTLRDG